MDYNSTFWEILQKTKKSVYYWDKILNLGPNIKPSNKEEIFEYNRYRTTRKQLCKVWRM